jgi:hypothetical protein
VAWARLGVYLSRFICRLCAGTVRLGDLRCHYCGTLIPALDFQTRFFIVLALAGLLLLMVVLLIWANL